MRLPTSVSLIFQPSGLINVFEVPYKEVFIGNKHTNRDLSIRKG